MRLIFFACTLAAIGAAVCLSESPPSVTQAFALGAMLGFMTGAEFAAFVGRRKRGA